MTKPKEKGLILMENLKEEEFIDLKAIERPAGGGVKTAHMRMILEALAQVKFKCTVIGSPRHRRGAKGAQGVRKSPMLIPHICHGHHGRCPCKFILSGVKFSTLSTKNAYI